MVGDIVTLVLLFWRIINVIENCYPKNSHSVLHNENEILAVYYAWYKVLNNGYIIIIYNKKICIVLIIYT
jgi:hypothetical protein